MNLKDKKYIKLYAEDFDRDVWEEYCKVAEVPLSAISISIFFNPKEVEYCDGEEENDYNLPEEDTVSLDDLCLEDIDDEDEVEEAISEYLSDTYGFCHKGFEWERGDDVDTIDIYNIKWDTGDNEESDDEEDGNYLIVEEDGTKHYYDDEPDVDVIHGFVVGMCVDITIYKKTEDGDWEEVDSYHA